MQTKTIFKMLKCTTFIFLITLITVNLCIAQDYTLCRGDNVEVGPFPDPPPAFDRPPGPEGSGDYGLPGCIFQRRNISPEDGVISNTGNGYILSPLVTTTYTYTSYYGGGSSNGCNPGDEFSVTFTVVVEDCEPCQTGSSPDCPSPFEDYTICSGQSVETTPFPHPYDAVDSPFLPACTTLIGDISPLNGVITKNSDNYISYVLAPTETTTYTFTTYYGSSETSSNCYPGETYSLSFTVFVEDDCNDTPQGTILEICPGEATTLLSPYKPGDSPGGPCGPSGPPGSLPPPCPCNGVSASNIVISPQDGVVVSSPETGEFLVSPAITTTYNISVTTSLSAPVHTGCDSQTFTNTYTVVVNEESCEKIIQEPTTVTICKGANIEIGPVIEPPRPLPSTLECKNIVRTITPYQDIVSDLGDSFIVAPEVTTTYSLSAQYAPIGTGDNCVRSLEVLQLVTVIVEEDCEPCEPGSSPDCPYIIESCPGERVTLIGNRVGAPPPPLIVVIDVGTSDFSNVDYRIDGPNGNVCIDCNFTWVYPETTSLYTLTWANTLPPTPPNQFYGTGYFLVEVQDCPTQTDLIAPNESPDIKFTVRPTELIREGEQNIKVDFYNDGPGYIESVDFIWEINGVNEGTTSYIGSSVLAGGNISAVLPDYFFEADTDYTIKVTATDVNGDADLNPQNNVYEFFLPAFDSAPDLSVEITEPVNPIENGVGVVKVNVSSRGSSYVNDFVINWSVNGTLQTPYTVNDVEWNSFSSASGTLSYSIGSVNFNTDNDYEIKAWVELLGNEEDVDLTNNETTFFYSADDMTLYNADEVFTICEGETLTFTKNYHSYGAGCWSCFSELLNPTWSLNGATIATGNEIIITPTSSGLYRFTSNANTDCNPEFCGPGPVGPQPYQVEFVERDYGVIVVPCNDGGGTDEIFDDYPWLNTVVDVNNCNGTSVTVYDAGTFNYVFVETNDGGALYFQDGTYYCTERSNFNCVDAYNLTQVVNTWTCGENESVFGCIDSQACNFNPNATMSDGSCTYADPFATCSGCDDVPGCTDPAANNYNPEANCNPGGPFGCSYDNGYSPGTYDFDSCPYDIIEIQLVGPCTKNPYTVSFNNNSFDNILTWDIDENDLLTVEISGENVLVISGIGATDSGSNCETEWIFNFNINEANCGNSNEVFNDFSWLNSVIDQNNCNGSSVTVYTTGTFNYLFVETNEGGALYFQDGTYYCTERNNFNCVDAYNLTQVVDTWNCGIIEVEILGCIDPQASNYNSSATVDDDSCEYDISNEIFNNFPWLNSVVDPNNCLGTSVTVYTTGNFNYLFVETNEGAALYFQDGTYYCTERSNFNCVDAYGLTEVVDNWTCGLIGIEILGCTDPRALNYNPEATVDDDDCEYDIRPEIFGEYEWLESVVNINNCLGTSVTVYTTGNFNYLFVETNEGSALYFQNGTYYCTERSNFNCVNAYGLTEVVNTWTCDIIPVEILGCTDIQALNYNPDATVDDGSCAFAPTPNCNNHTGTFFFENCGGQTYFFIETTAGQIFDPYFAEGISFSPLEGQTVNFDYELNTEITTPCNISENPITITCIEIVESSNDEVFSTFNWLSSVVDPNNCEGASITVYTTGTFNYLFVETNAGAALYFQDGTYYCTERSNFNCVDAYNLIEVVDTWTCGIMPVEILDDGTEGVDIFITACAGEPVNLPLPNTQLRCVCFNYDNTVFYQTGLLNISGDDSGITQNGNQIVATTTESRTYTIVAGPKLPPGFGCGCNLNMLTVRVIIEGCDANYLPSTQNFMKTDKDSSNENSLETTKKLEQNFEIKLYPNPTKGQFNIELSQPIEETYVVNVFDMNGQLIQSLNEQTQQNVRIDLTNEPEGVYMVQLLGENLVQMQKIIKH